MSAYELNLHPSDWADKSADGIIGEINAEFVKRYKESGVCPAVLRIPRAYFDLIDRRPVSKHLSLSILHYLRLNNLRGALGEGALRIIANDDDRKM